MSLLTIDTLSGSSHEKPGLCEEMRKLQEKLKMFDPKDGDVPRNEILEAMKRVQEEMGGEGSKEWKLCPYTVTK